MDRKYVKDIQSLFPLIEESRLLASIEEKLIIDFSQMDPAHCYEENISNTPSGKKPKYKMIYHFAYYRQLPGYDGDGLPDINWKPGKELFGEIKYLQDGTIGQSKIIFWTDKRNVYVIEIKAVKSGLFVSKVTGNNYSILYKK